MLYALSWFLSLALLAFWSLACWGLYALTVWAMAGAGALAGGGAAMGAALWPAWATAWIPPQLTADLQAMLAAIGPMVQAALETVPLLSGAVSVLAWAIWGLGALLLLALAIGAHVLIAVLKSRKSRQPLPGATAAH